MASSKFYLDTRHTGRGRTATLKVAVMKGRGFALLNTRIRLRPDQWRDNRVVNHPDRKVLNAIATRKKAAVDDIILKGTYIDYYASLTAAQIRDLADGGERDGTGKDGGLFLPALLRAAESKGEGTRGVYMQTYRRVLAFDPKAGRLRLGDVTVEWLTRLDSFLALTAPSPNSRAIHFRNIRAVLNREIAAGAAIPYPFRNFRIRHARTAHRALTAEQLRTLFGWPVEDYAELHRDIFKLMFFLIGINMKDLFNLERLTPDGRAEYSRAKTGRAYSIRVEPEAMEIIDKYRGRKRLLCMADTYADHRDYLHHLNDALKSIGPTTYGRRGRKTVNPLFPNLSSYWARHSWATAAAELDIPKETIAAALGHADNSVTGIYIDFNRRKVDEANRRVMDYVLYGKR